MTPPKNNAGGLHVFPDKPGMFDNTMSEAMRGAILSTAEQMDRPTRNALAERLGMLGDRLTRLMRGLGIILEYRKLRHRKGIGVRKKQPVEDTRVIATYFDSWEVTMQDFFDHLKSKGISPDKVPQGAYNEFLNQEYKEAMKGCDAKIQIIEEDPPE